MKRFLANILMIVFIFANPCAAGYYQKIVVSSTGEAYHNFFTPENGSKSISKYIPETKSLSIDYTINEQNNCNIDTISLDRLGNKIAYCEACKLSLDGIPSDMYPYYYRLAILDTKCKKIIVKFDNGGNTFSFSPKGDAIVYAEEIPGERGSPAPPGYKGGIWLYNFNTKINKQISSKSLGNADINWSEHDENIYIGRAGWSRRYNVSKGEWEQVPYNGIYFSHDGKYYTNQITEVNASKIYQTSDNKEMTDWNAILLSISGGQREFPPSIAFKFWSKELNSVIFGVSNTKNVVFDVEKGEVIGEFWGRIIGTNTEGSLVAIHPVKPDDSRIKDKTKVEIINLLEIVNIK